MKAIQESIDFLNSATGGQVTGFGEEESETFDPLIRVFVLSLAEPFPKSNMKYVRSIIKTVCREHGFDVKRIKAYPSALQVTGHIVTPAKNVDYSGIRKTKGDISPPLKA
jgi:hypothetical protein